MDPGLEEALHSARLADIAMHAMPPLDYDQLATKTDLTALASELRGEMAELRGELRGEMAELKGELRGEMAELKGEMAELRGDMLGLRGDVKSELASQLRLILVGQVTTMIMLGGWVAAVT